MTPRRHSLRPKAGQIPGPKFHPVAQKFSKEEVALSARRVEPLQHIAHRFTINHGDEQDFPPAAVLSDAARHQHLIGLADTGSGTVKTLQAPATSHSAWSRSASGDGLFSWSRLPYGIYDP